MILCLHIKHFLLSCMGLVRGALKAGETFCKRVKELTAERLRPHDEMLTGDVELSPENTCTADDLYAWIQQNQKNLDALEFAHPGTVIRRGRLTLVGFGR